MHAVRRFTAAKLALLVILAAAIAFQFPFPALKHFRRDQMLKVRLRTLVHYAVPTPKRFRRWYVRFVGRQGQILTYSCA